MENFDIATTLVIVIGLLVRFGIPIIITLAVVFILRKLDANWRKEAEETPLAVNVENQDSWDATNCSPDPVSECPTSTSIQPCWQIHRQKNGYLREECLTCQIFHQATLPAPVHP
jgi:hypothetical protein